MTKLAITGGIGSGKSYVCSLLRSHGVSVYDCDSAAKRIMRTDKDVIRRIIEAVGADAYSREGVLNKKVLATYILSSEEAAHRINSIVHPAVASDFLESGQRVMECAILYQSGFDALVGRVACVTAPLDVRVERVMARDSISRSKALEWINCQMSQDEMARRSDFVIENDGCRELGGSIEKLVELVGLDEQK